MLIMRRRGRAGGSATRGVHLLLWGDEMGAIPVHTPPPLALANTRGRFPPPSERSEWQRRADLGGRMMSTRRHPSPNTPALGKLNLARLAGVNFAGG